MQRLSLMTLALAVAIPDAAAARDLTGKLGIGGYLDRGPISPALSIKYWVSDLGLQALFAFDTKVSNDVEAGYLEYRPALRVLYAMTRARDTNLYGGVGLSGIFRNSKEGGGNTAFFDAVIGVEHFFGDAFSVGGHVTLSVELGKSPQRTLDSASWGGSFHFYF